MKRKIVGLFFCMMLITGMNFASSTNSFNEKNTITKKTHSQDYLLYENFSGTFPPEGWSTDWWTQCNGSCRPESPCACFLGDHSNSYITSKTVDASNYGKINLRFFLDGSYSYPQYTYIWIKIKINETSQWKDITPWDNPISEHLLPFLLDIDIVLGPDNSADAFQFNLSSYEVYGSNIKLYLDDVLIYNSHSNNPPNPPIIEGSSKGKIGVEHEYTFNATDPDDDPVMYIIEWADNNTEWTEYIESGEEIILKHTWSDEGVYTIKAKAKDLYNEESDWTYFEVTMPKSYNNPLWGYRGFGDRFSLLQRLIEVLIR